jgi:hypothetical protein
MSGGGRWTRPVVGTGWRDCGTRITIADGKVTQMQQYKT